MIDRGFHCVQNGSEAHPGSCPMGTRSSFHESKAVGVLADRSPPSSAEVKNAWSYASTPQYAFMVWCSVKAQGQHLQFRTRDVYINFINVDKLEPVLLYTQSRKIVVELVGRCGIF
jgi:hypothetical protein